MARKAKNAIEAARLGLTFDENLSELKPTQARPGSPEKIRILADRVSRGLPLHVTGDAKLEKKAWQRHLVDEMPDELSIQQITETDSEDDTWPD